MPIQQTRVGSKQPGYRLCELCTRKGSNGSAITSVAGVLSQMDPIAALLVVLTAELSVRLRRPWKQSGTSPIVLDLIDMSRIGFLYGLFLEAFKLI